MTRLRHTPIGTEPVSEEHDELQVDAREQLAEWILGDSGPKMDVSAADSVKRLGLIANYDE